MSMKMIWEMEGRMDEGGRQWGGWKRKGEKEEQGDVEKQEQHDQITDSQRELALIA